MKIDVINVLFNTYPLTYTYVIQPFNTCNKT